MGKNDFAESAMTAYNEAVDGEVKETAAEAALGDNFVRNVLLHSALKHTEALKGAKRDTAVFDYLCGAVLALFTVGEVTTPVPGWLWVIGIRGGARVDEIKRMLTPPVGFVPAEEATPDGK